MATAPTNFPCLNDAKLAQQPEIVTCVMQRQNLDAIFDSVGESIATVAPNYVLTNCNTALAQMLDRQSEEIIGCSVQDSIGLIIPEIGEVLSDIFDKGVGVRDLCLECPVEEADSARTKTYILNIGFLHAHIDPTKKSGVIIVIRDTTELHDLRREMLRRAQFQRLVGSSKPMQTVYRLLEHVAPTDATTLILGDSGTGKELIAHSIHNLSSRQAGPFIKVSCAALSQTLLESELFGHVRGSFTGALRDRVGRFEMAEGGSILLDEIGEIEPSVQVKLLRVLQERVIERVGDSKSRKVDVRIMASTNRNLKQLIKEGKFREDLYYRLKVVEIHAPALRDRRSDIPVLLEHLIRKLNERYNRKIEGVAPETLRALMNYDWPGNVRELENVLEHALVLCKEGLIRPSHLPQEVTENGGSDFRAAAENGSAELAQVEARSRKRMDPEEEPQIIREALERAGGRVGRAAKHLQMHRTTLWRKMRQYGIEPED